MAFYGVNPSNLENAITNVNSAYADLYTAILNTSSTYMSGLAACWGNKNGKDFGEDLERTINQFLKNVTKVFDSVNDSMNSAGKIWNRNNGDGSFSPVGFNSKNGDIQNTIRTAMPNGDEGLDEAIVNSETETYMNDLASKVSEAVVAAKQAVSNTGFLGGGQEAALQNSISSIASQVDEIEAKIASEVSKITGKNIESSVKCAQLVTDGFSG